jgi:hypothetical protein
MGTSLKIFSENIDKHSKSMVFVKIKFPETLDKVLVSYKVLWYIFFH